MIAGEQTEIVEKPQEIVKREQIDTLKKLKDESDADYKKRSTEADALIAEGKALPKGWESETLIKESKVTEIVKTEITKDGFSRGKATKLEMYTPLLAHQVSKAVKNYIQ